MILFRQLFDRESATYTYLLSDGISGQAILIDPVLECLDRDLNLVGELGLTLSHSLETHAHADHITSSGELRERTHCVTVVSAASGVKCADRLVKEGDEILSGSLRVTVLSTPGHTNGCVSYLCQGRIFTGDALCIRSAGRTDFQAGSAETLFRSIHDKLYTLPDSTLVFPGHDYQGMTVSTIGEEKQFNRRISLSITREQFVDKMNSLKLPEPKKIAIAVPANLNCGKAI